MEMNVCRKGGHVHMKKILAIMLCAVMTLSLVACGEEKGEMSAKDSGISTSEESNKTNDSNIMEDNEVVSSLENELEENNKTVSEDNPLIGTWVCQTNDSLIYTFVNDTDLEILDAGETIMYTYQFDGDNLSISDGDMLQITSMIVSEDGFTLCGDEILEFKNINGFNSESDNETNAGTEGEITEESNDRGLSAVESQLIGTWECELNGGFYTKTYTFNSDRTGVIQDTSSGLTSQFDLWKYDGGVLYYESNFTYSDGSAGKDIGNLNINLKGETFSCVNLWGEEEVYTKK